MAEQTHDAVQTLLDVHEIANLQGRYLYYVQAHDYERIVSLFAEQDPEVSVEIAESGIYVGVEKVRALFTGLIEPLFTAPGSLPIHMLNTPVIEVARDGTTAAGMWQTLGCNAFSTSRGLTAVWQQGKYDNRFVKEGGRWKFKQFRWLCNFRTPFDQGWVKQPHLGVEQLDLSAFPASLHPSRQGEKYETFDPLKPMDFGPLPPEPMD